jgi:hypothetical protein
LSGERIGKGGSMNKAAGLFLVAFLATPAAPAAPPAAAPPRAGAPADFKLVMSLYGVEKTPVKKVDVVVHEGKVLHFNARTPLEVIVFDPVAKRVELIDLDRKLRTVLGMSRLDTFLENLRDAVAAASTKREAQGGKANEVAAAMSRDLIDPRFAAAFDPKAHTVRLDNASVNFEGHGEPEADRTRLALIAEALAAFAKLESMRDPSAIPPFTRLEALRVMTADHQLRPTEMSFVYRLAGPPRKYRWTYDLTPALTEREVQAIALIDLMKARCQVVRFERYQKSEKNEAR